MAGSDSAGSRGWEFRLGDAVAQRYKLLEVLELQSATATYRAQDTATRQIVALKLIRPGAAKNLDSVRQFKHEMSLLRQTGPRGFVRILDLGEYLGHLYLAMELVEGRTLQNYLEQVKKLTLEQFLQLFFELCDALSQLHAQNVIHRDINLSQIRITTAGALKLMDFSITRDLSAPSVETPAEALPYVAPEQRKGQTATFATDIYSTGAVGYTMLTGKQPPVSTNKDDGSPVRPRAAFLDLPEVPPSVVGMLETCLEAEPVKRFQSVTEIKNAVSRIRESASVSSTRVRLETLRRRDQPEPEQMIPVFLNMVTALRKLHEAGQFHRELSPANIWIDGETIEYEICPPPTAQGTLLIPDAKYSAPELLIADSIPDEASHILGDIYVLGFLFYEFLAGSQQMDAQLASIGQMRTGLGWMHWHTNRDQTLTSLKEVAPRCPGPLVDLVERMLQKDPTKRIRTFKEVEDTLAKLAVRMDRTAPIPLPVHQGSGQKTLKLVFMATLPAALILGLIFTRSWWLPRLSSALTMLGSNGSPANPPVFLRTASGSMVLVPGGAFSMGDASNPREAPLRTVGLRPFYIDQFEVSNLAYREFARKSGHALPNPPSWDQDYFLRDDYPVIDVTWDDAGAFCEFAGQRLPSDAEWEKAARGADDPSIVWGNWTMPGLANLGGTGAPRRPSPVGSFPADISPFGVMDLAGNVQEWVSDHSQFSDGSTVTLTPEATGQKPVRGGSFERDPAKLSPAWRGWAPDVAQAPQLSSVGFRCATDLSASLLSQQ